MTHTGGPEHDFEPVPGLPGRLPDGEDIVWQGAPASGAVALRVLKTRWIAGYFAALAIWNIVSGIHDGRTAGAILFSAGAIMTMGAIVVAMLEAFAWGVRRTTLYTITNRRVVMRIGVALSATFNLPFSQILSADMRADSKGNGDIALMLKPGHKLSLLVFWPHVRGWRNGTMIPQMIGLDDAEIAAQCLAQQLSMFAATRTTRIVKVPSLKQPETPLLHDVIVAAE
jgi:Bacterial PH domain